MNEANVISENDIIQENQDECTIDTVETYPKVIGALYKAKEIMMNLLFGSNDWCLREDDRFADKNIYNYAHMRLCYWGPYDLFSDFSQNKVYRELEKCLPEDHDDIDKDLLKKYVQKAIDLRKRDIDYNNRKKAALKDQEEGKEFMIVNTIHEFYGEKQMLREVKGEVELLNSLMSLNLTARNKLQDDIGKIFKYNY